MKLTDTKVEVESNMVFDETVAIGISAGAVAMVIEKLISTYKNPYRAALREYTSNAYDEHVAAGQTLPVEVSLPNELSPILKIQDYGRGLNREELKGYGLIGESSKQDSNLYTGGFGLGSKSALAASPQFTVVSVKDGRRNTVIVARDENNRPHMNFLKETETTDASGTTVIVPISNIDQFGDLTDFWIGWKPGSILIDEEEPKRTVYDTLKFREIRGGIGWYDLSNVASQRDELRILINQVYYSLNYKNLGLSYNQRELLKYYVIKIDNGSVEIAPSREDLIFNARTKAALEARMKELLTISAQVQADGVDAAVDLNTALLLRDKMYSSGFPVDNLTHQGRAILLPGVAYKGNTLPDPIGTWATPTRDGAVKSGWKVEKNWRELSAKKVWSPTEHRKFAIVHSIVGAPVSYGRWSNRFAFREASALGEYMQATMRDAQSNWDFFFTDEPANKVNRTYRELADIIVSADEFNAEVSKVRSERAKIERATRDARRLERKLKMYKGSGWTEDVQAQYIKDNYERLIILRNMSGGIEEEFRDSLVTKTHSRRSWNDTFRTLLKEHKTALVLLGKNDKIDDLLPLMPPVTTFDALAVMSIEKAYSTPTKWERMAWRDRANGGVQALVNLKDTIIDQVDRKATQEWLKALRDYRDETDAVRRQYSWMTSYFPNVAAAMKKINPDAQNDLPPTPLKRYPLLKSISSSGVDPEHILEYINFRDKTLKKG